MPDYLVGLDLGQSADPTALAVVRRSLALDAAGNATRDGWRMPECQYDVVHLWRPELGTPYPAIVTEVARLLARPELGWRPRLVVDATGVGRPVVDLFLAGDLRCYASAHPVTLTAGGIVRIEEWPGSTAQAAWLPKKDLAGAVVSALERGRLKVAPALPLAETLRAEMMAFKVRMTQTGHEQFGAMEGGAHDDLVVAVALAVWAGSRPEFALLWDQYDEAEREAIARLDAVEDAEAEALITRDLEAEAREFRKLSNPFWWTH